MSSYSTPGLTVQQVLLKHPSSCSETTLHVQKVLQHIRQCRTAAMGYHLYQCDNKACGHIKYQYHSCHDRHCPGCGALKKQQWIEARMQELLPVKYYHVVFTLPHELNSLILGHRGDLYRLLFNASSKTLLNFAADKRYLGATPGVISVLHTWGQQLSFHPHIHCIVSGGGITPDNNWKQATGNKGRFLFPVKAMSIVYRAKFLEGLKQLIKSKAVIPPANLDIQALINILYRKEWVVYAKAPFGGPHTVIAYLGRYTHKVAISNHRIVHINEQTDTVTFEYKDYADQNKQKQMTLEGGEFIRRFRQHILPERFTKIRTYGYLANRNRRQRINEVLGKLKLPLHPGQVKVPVQVMLREKYGININQCPCCNENSLKLVQVYYPWKRGDDG